MKILTDGGVVGVLIGKALEGRLWVTLDIVGTTLCTTLAGIVGEVEESIGIPLITGVD